MFWLDPGGLIGFRCLVGSMCFGRIQVFWSAPGVFGGIQVLWSDSGILGGSVIRFSRIRHPSKMDPDPHPSYKVGYGTQTLPNSAQKLEKFRKMIKVETAVFR